MVAAGVAAQAAGIDVGDVVAGSAVDDAILDVANRLAQQLGVLARRAQHVERQPLRALGANARQLLELVDELLQRRGQRHQSPGIPRPPRSPPIFCFIASSTLRCASLIAATIKSCSMPTSSFDTTSGSSVIFCRCLWPFTVTVTMPPPEVASTESSDICCCRRSCISCACFIMF